MDGLRCEKNVCCIDSSMYLKSRQQKEFLKFFFDMLKRFWKGFYFLMDVKHIEWILMIDYCLLQILLMLLTWENVVLFGWESLKLNQQGYRWNKDWFINLISMFHSFLFSWENLSISLNSHGSKTMVPIFILSLSTQI